MILKYHDMNIVELGIIPRYGTHNPVTFPAKILIILAQQKKDIQES